LEGSGRGLIFKYYPKFRLEGLSKTSTNLSRDSRCPDREQEF